MIFNLTIQGETVIVSSLTKGSSGTVEKYSQTIHPGEYFDGCPYEQLRVYAEEDGWLKINEGTT